MPTTQDATPVRTDAEGDTSFVRLSGSIGVLVVDALRDALLQQIEAPQLVIDLSGARHLDTSAWQVVVAAVRARRERALATRLVDVPEAIEAFTSLAGLEAELEACR